MKFDSIACDWLTIRHDYPALDDTGATGIEAVNAGKVMKLDRDGCIEFISECWDTVRCPSSDTSIRIKCDGRHLYASGNIGRFQQQDNREGLTIEQCMERWREVLGNLGFNLHGFGQIHKAGSIHEWGTHITRVDLCSNFEVSDYSAFVQSCMVRRIGQKLPMLGKYGPTWGYDSKRSNWVKAKIYDKTAELQGLRRSLGGATLARFEIQLGNEYLRREKLDNLDNWIWDRHRGAIDMANIIYGKFSDQVFIETTSVHDWADIPPKLRCWAVLWRDGNDIRTELKKSQYYTVRRALLGYGIDIGAPCNVTALVRASRIVEVTPVNTLRAA